MKTGRACRMREVLQDIYTDSRTPSEAWVRLHRLCSWMMHSRLEPMKDFARMIRRHFAEIVAYFEHPYTNAVLEGADSVIQNVKRRARPRRNAASRHAESARRRRRACTARRYRRTGR